MDFQGFQNNLPDFLVLLIVFILIGIAILSYNKLKSIPTLPRIGLISLRSLSFLLIFLLFLNPYFYSSEIIKKKPKIMVFLDNSESTTIQKGIYNGIETYQKLLSDLNLKSNNKIDFEYFTIGSSTKQIGNIDSLIFTENETNFASAISQIQELEDDFDAGILISDGIITYGRNPVLQASNISIPLYSIALGDTSKVKDLIINNLVYNPNGYTDTRHSVEVQISQNGFSNNQTKVSLLDSKGTLLDNKTVLFNEDEETISIDFEIELKQTGLQQFKIEADPLNGEWSIENNASTLSIDVTDSKTNILHVAFEIHPDVKMLRSILTSDENIELNTLTWLGGTKFIEENLVNLNDIDLLIFHGLPSTLINTNVFSSYQETPTLYLQLPKSRENNPRLYTELDLITNNGKQIYQVSIEPLPESIEHPILELPEIGYQNISPIIGSLRSISNTPDAVTLFKSVYQGIRTPNDIINVLERGNVRRATVSAWNWYKMYQSPNVSEREFVTQLFVNLASWTSNNPDNRRLKIAPSRSVFSNNETVIINANLNNESGETESEATIEISLESEFKDNRNFTMSNDGDGKYKLEIASLSAGLYSFSAIARKGDREIDSQKGEFLVQDSNSELINTVRNEELLRTISNETNAIYFTFNNISNFWNSLDESGILIQKEESVDSYTFPVRSFLWFLVILTLLSVEWIGRKFYSLP